MPTTAELMERVARQADAEGLLDVAVTTHDTTLGPLVLAATPNGLVLISYEDADAAQDHLARKVSPRVLAAPKRLDRTRRQLDDYLGGHRRQFDLDLDWRLTSAFQRRVLEQVSAIPYGRVDTYAGVATAIGQPTAVRATGGANARNPLPIVVPCHRVIGTSGSLTGYGGGIERKAYLLDLEAGR